MDRFGPQYQIGFDSSKVSAENIKKFNKVRSILEKEYYMDVDENTLLEGAVAGMADSLKDPYTSYFNKEQMKMFMEKSEGSYVGIGISITTDNNGLLTVIEPFEGSPAAKAGIKQGDKIIKVDDSDVTAIKDENMVISMIKGKENTNVKVTVYRQTEGKSIDFELVRKKIKISNISSEIMDGNIGYIKLVMFDSNIAKDFEEHLNKLLQKKIRGLVIDLRDDPGGDYSQVVQIADRLLPKGLIVYTEDRNKRRAEEQSDEKELEMPISVLINGNSASASEILAGALKDHKKATLVGTKSFGKGLVQTIRPLDDGSGIKVTIARYFTPSGVCIQGIGIMPDIEVTLDEKYKGLPASQVPKEDDVQLKKALEAVKAAQ
ncbi:MAG: S41 family peptidase [Clostridia bacterium]|nr:S41 family peptidase [Clostridia bacterium]